MNKIKLNNLSERSLSNEHLTKLYGGEEEEKICLCSCYYAGQPGGSSIVANRDANYNIHGGGYSAKGKNDHFKETPDN